MKYTQQNLVGISTDTRAKLKILSIILDKPMTRIVEIMTDRLWEEKQDLVSSKYSQLAVNKDIRKILKSMVPK